MQRYPSNESTTREPALAWLRALGLSAPASGLGPDAEAPAFFTGPQTAWALETWMTGGESLAELEERSVAGESIAARSLAAVHAVIVALSGAEPAQPRASVRDRLLASAGKSSVPAAQVRPSQAPTLVPPVVAVGQTHAKRADDAARVAAVARLGADRREGDAQLERLLARAAAWLDFPLLVVSIVHGGQTVHRAYHTTLSDPPRVVPREASYCTHCVAGDAPLVVEDARKDAFFSQHPAVGAFGLVAYCGVPLRVGIGTADEAVVGTLCGYDVRSRPVLVEDAATLEIFARRVASIIERDDSTKNDADADAGDEDAEDPCWSDAGSRDQKREVLAPGPFVDLALVALRRASHGGDRCALLVGPAVASIPHDDSLIDAGFALAAGRLPDGRSGWLVRARAEAPVDAQGADEKAADSFHGVVARLATELAVRLDAPIGVAHVGDGSSAGSASSAAAAVVSDVDAWVVRATRT
jgi:hypothetical protein